MTDHPWQVIFKMQNRCKQLTAKEFINLKKIKCEDFCFIAEMELFAVLMPTKLISMWQQGYSHTSLVPLRCKPSCQSGPKALPSFSDAPLSLPFSSLPEGKRWSRSDLVCILPCPQNSEQGFSINKKIPSGCQRVRGSVIALFFLPDV